MAKYGNCPGKKFGVLSSLVGFGVLPDFGFYAATFSIMCVCVCTRIEGLPWALRETFSTGRHTESWCPSSFLWVTWVTSKGWPVPWREVSVWHSRNIRFKQTRKTGFSSKLQPGPLPVCATAHFSGRVFLNINCIWLDNCRCKHNVIKK